MTSTLRTMVLWSPDWPILAIARDQGIDPVTPIALTDRGRIFACSAAARADGVTRGLRLREAQGRSIGLTTFPYDAALDSRAFEPVIAAIEEVAPGVQLVRPGTCAVRSRGPARYYGGEEAAAAAMLRTMADHGIPVARVGIADGPFAAEQAARLPGAEALRIVPPEGSAAFLAPLPTSLLVSGELAGLLRRLGIGTLGELAALGAAEVRARFGEDGARAHLIAAGLDPSGVRPRTPPLNLARSIRFEPGLDRIDQLAFAVRTTADDFIEGITAARFVCTAIRIELISERGETSERSWLHPRWFSANDVVDRVRWQVQGAGGAEAGLDSPIVEVRILPDSTDRAGNHEEGLWGSGPDERIHHGFARVQGMLGHDGVLTVARTGGRLLRDRQVLVPWGDRPVGLRPADQPWPGSMPPPLPSTVFPAPHPVAVVDAGGEPVVLDDRGFLQQPPARFSATVTASGPGRLQDVTSWAGPWPIRERWWDSSVARELNRFQLVDDSGTAWLLVLKGRRWWAEARYD